MTATIQDALARGNARAPSKDIAALVGPAGWARLPAAVRARFGANVRGANYDGEGVFDASPLGRAFAILGLAFGRPLPLRTGTARVRIEVRAQARGEVWRRVYQFANGVEPVSSIKHAGAGPWLEERAGLLIMRLDVFEEAGALVFECMDFALRLGPASLNSLRALRPLRSNSCDELVDEAR